MGRRGTGWILFTMGIILLGLLSRTIAVIPLWVGDLLYAVMIYGLVRACNYNVHIMWTFLCSLGICVAIELSQLSDHFILMEIRSFKMGRLILGQGFLWSDVIAYVSGCTIAALTDHFSRTIKFRSGRKQLG